MLQEMHIVDYTFSLAIIIGRLFFLYYSSCLCVCVNMFVHVFVCVVCV